jgi:ATP-dependent DNA helicase RecG
VTKHADRPEADRVVNFPLAAIEEAVVNAVYHRGYDQREPVEVRITREELVVLSYPGPDRSVRLDQLRAGRASPRRYPEPADRRVLKELELTEGRGTGIPKILRAMRENGSPPPIFEFDEDHLYFAVTLPVHPQAAYPRRRLGPPAAPPSPRVPATGSPGMRRPLRSTDAPQRAAVHARGDAPLESLHLEDEE